jgi:hypothetical protein
VIESVTIDGAAIALADVFASVTIRHGRGSLDDGPLGSTATLSLVNVARAFVAPFKVGVELAIATTGAVPRFVGRISDAALDPDAATLSVIAASTLARISGRKIGAAAWPQEAWSARITRAFTEADAAAELVLELGVDDPQVAARAAGETTLGGYLATVAVTVATAIADLPDGRVLVQAVSSRRGADPVELPSESVALAPEWTQNDDVANVVQVTWSGGVVEDVDASSIATYEERAPLALQTDLAVEADATSRAAIELSRRSRPDWHIERADLLVLNSDLAIGTPVIVRDLPAAAPADHAVGIIEGWEDHVEPDAVAGLDWTMQLNLSPIRLSGYGATWANINPAITWATLDPALTWAENEELLFA